MIKAGDFMLIIENIYENIIKIEDENSHFTITSDKIKGNIKEGDVLVKTSDGFYTADNIATEKRRNYMTNLQDELFD